MINFNTDLADERRDIYRKANKIEKDVPGIETEERIEAATTGFGSPDEIDIASEIPIIA